MKETNPKDALGCRRPPLSTVPANVLLEVGAAMLEGASKYGRHNWRVAGIRSSVYYDACLRHLLMWWEGENVDHDSGVSHITKAIAGLVVLRDAQMRGQVTDDRPPTNSRTDFLRQVQSQVTDILAKYPDPKPPYTEETHGGEKETTT
tara:strand:- start:5496 stop:5939 length:444 start_codon:yes stop_codon:yes gene_type:complete